MDMLIPRINYFSDLKNHSYFFIDPKFDTEISNNLRKRAYKDKQKAL